MKNVLLCYKRNGQCLASVHPIRVASLTLPSCSPNYPRASRIGWTLARYCPFLNSFMNEQLLEIKKPFKKSNREIFEIKKSFKKSNGQILEIKKPFEKSNGEILEIKKSFEKSKNYSRNQTDKTRIKTYNYFSDTPRTP